MPQGKNKSSSKPKPPAEPAKGGDASKPAEDKNVKDASSSKANKGKGGKKK